MKLRPFDMKLSTSEESLLRQYMASVEGIIATYVPSPVPGVVKYNQMMAYLNHKEQLEKMILSSIEPKKKSKWRQKDLLEAIKEEKEKQCKV